MARYGNFLQCDLCGLPVSEVPGTLLYSEQGGLNNSHRDASTKEKWLHLSVYSLFVTGKRCTCVLWVRHGYMGWPGCECVTLGQVENSVSELGWVHIPCNWGCSRRTRAFSPSWSWSSEKYRVYSVHPLSSERPELLYDSSSEERTFLFSSPLFLLSSTSRGKAEGSILTTCP